MAEPTSLDVTLRALDLLEVAGGSTPAATLELVRQDVEALDHTTLARLVAGLVIEATANVWSTATESTLFRSRVQERRLRLMVGPL